MSPLMATLPTMSAAQCCSHYPWCVHQSRQPSSQVRSPASLGVAFGTSWDCSMSPSYDSHYSYAPPPPPPTFHYPSEELESLSMKAAPRVITDPMRLSVSEHKSVWTQGEGDANNYLGQQWLSQRPESQSMDTSQMYINGCDYSNSGHRYPDYGLRDVSPSKTTDFSGLSASSEPSPVISTAPSHYEYLIKHEDGQAFPSSQPFLPQEVEPAVKEGGERFVLPKGTKEVLVIEPKTKARARRAKTTEVIHCKICFKSFDRKSNYKSHCETHERERERVRCKAPDCNKTFGRTAEMTRHYKSSHDRQSHSCDACKRDLTRHDILLRHQSDACPVIHNGKPPNKRRRGRNSFA